MQPGPCGGVKRHFELNAVGRDEVDGAAVINAVRRFGYVGRITNDKLELRKQRISLATVVDSAMETSRALIERSKHRIEIALPEEDVYLDADPIRGHRNPPHARDLLKRAHSSPVSGGGAVLEFSAVSRLFCKSERVAARRLVDNRRGGEV